MTFVYDLFVVLHMIGLAAVVGSYFTVLREPRWSPGFLHGGLTQLVSGLVLVMMREMKLLDDEDPLNHAKIGVKLLVCLAVVALAFMTRNKKPADPNLIHAIGGLAILNILVAVLWH